MSDIIERREDDPIGWSSRLYSNRCPRCGSTHIECSDQDDGLTHALHCQDCHFELVRPAGEQPLSLGTVRVASAETAESSQAVVTKFVLRMF